MKSDWFEHCVATRKVVRINGAQERSYGDPTCETLCTELDDLTEYSNLYFLC